MYQGEGNIYRSRADLRFGCFFSECSIFKLLGLLLVARAHESLNKSPQSKLILN